ncbi:eukaryotic aspartyl protease [Poronia punctata]|nr:eukaryotic aspartyl protease [Poronia punctata]
MMRYYYGAVVVTSSLLVDNLASAVPVEKRAILLPSLQIPNHDGVAFKIHQVPNKNFEVAPRGRGAMALAKAYYKYGADVPADLQSYVEQILKEFAIAENPDGKDDGAKVPQGQVAATPKKFDSEYLCPVQIGIPPQTLNLDFDTGSSDLWVFSSETPPGQVGGQAIFNIGQSSTAKLLSGESWNIRYGDGSTSSGQVYSDTVTIGGITVENQAVESATDVSLSFTQRTGTDGFVGLAFSVLNTVKPTKQPTFFANAVKALATPLFTANLKPSQPGTYNFGFIDPTEFTGAITYVPVNAGAGLWEFTIEGFIVGSSPTIDTRHQAIADTGTTLLLVPDSIAAAYYAQVAGAVKEPAAGGYVFPCSQSLPSYTAMIGSYQATIPGDLINFAPVDATMCFGGIQTLPPGFNFAIYGDIFLKSQFVVFHGGNEPQLGFATKPL